MASWTRVFFGTTAFLLLGIFVTGCAEDLVRQRAQNDLGCNADMVKVVETAHNTFTAYGCGEQKTYTCVEGRGHDWSCIREGQ